MVLELWNWSRGCRDGVSIETGFKMWILVTSSVVQEQIYSSFGCSRTSDTNSISRASKNHQACKKCWFQYDIAVPLRSRCMNSLDPGGPSVRADGEVPVPCTDAAAAEDDKCVGADQPDGVTTRSHRPVERSRHPGARAITLRGGKCLRRGGAGWGRASQRR